MVKSPKNKSRLSKGIKGDIITDKKSVDSDVQIKKTTIYTGPLPLPERLEEYERILPGSADRICTLAEKNQEDRSNENSKILKSDGEVIRGSIFVSLVLILVSGWLAYILRNDPLIAALVFASGPVTTIMTKAFNKK